MHDSLQFQYDLTFLCTLGILPLDEMNLARGDVNPSNDIDDDFNGNVVGREDDAQEEAVGSDGEESNSGTLQTTRSASSSTESMQSETIISAQSESESIQSGCGSAGGSQSEIESEDDDGEDDDEYKSTFSEEEDSHSLQEEDEDKQAVESEDTFDDEETKTGPHNEGTEITELMPLSE